MLIIKRNLCKCALPILLIMGILIIGLYSPAMAVYGGINLVTPVSAPVNAGYLYAEKLTSSSTYGHHGLDFAAASGSNVYAAYTGKVVTKANLGDDSYGKYIIIESDHPNYAGVKFYHLYAHLSDYSDCPAVNQTVNQGNKIAESGSSGGATGPHLHFEIRMGTNSWYSQRNPEGLLSRSTSDDFGGILGEVRTSGGSWARYKRISGATKGTDINYGASYSYFVMANGNPFPDEASYGINYYIARATTGNKTLSYDYGARTQNVTIYANTDYKVNTIYLP